MCGLGDAQDALHHLLRRLDHLAAAVVDEIGGTVQSAVGSSWWDRWIVDGLVRFIGGFIKTVSWPVRLVQTGYVQNYALVMILGVLFFIGYVLWGTP